MISLFVPNNDEKVTAIAPTTIGKVNRSIGKTPQPIDNAIKVEKSLHFEVAEV
jgi:hypothetical protein